MLNSLRDIWKHPLNRRNRVAALGRWLRWQLRCRVSKRPMVYEWVAGVKMLVHPGERGLTQNLYCGLQDFAEMSFILHALRREDCFADIGANAGSYTLLACGARGASGLAVEPVPSTHERLRNNLSINGLDGRVSCFRVALGSSEGALQFSTQLDCSNHVLAEEEARDSTAVSVPVKRLDDLCASCMPTFLKMDVEGFETEVIRGGGAVFSNPTQLAFIIEMNGSGRRYGFDEQELKGTIEGWGFQPCAYDPFARKITAMQSGSSGEGNTLYIRDLDAVSARVRSAPVFEVHGNTV